MEIKGLPDSRIIEFLHKSPVKSFETILDTLAYLDSQWIHDEIEYELFDAALGDNPQGAVRIRGCGSPNVLFELSKLFETFHFIRRRPSHDKAIPNDSLEGEVRVRYELTRTGRRLHCLLQQIDLGKELMNMDIGGDEL